MCFFGGPCATRVSAKTPGVSLKWKKGFFLAIGASDAGNEIWNVPYKPSGHII